MAELFTAPDLDPAELRALKEVHDLRAELGAVLRVPRRWTGGLRRSAQGRAIRGSNSIEGYVVSEQDAVAAVDDLPPLTADEQTWAEITAYRRVLTYVIHMGAVRDFRIDSQTVRSLHFMLLEHDLSKGPGRYRPGDVYVHDERTDETVYQGPPAEQVPGLVDSLVEQLAVSAEHDPIVSAAMAHLNLVMIHPFRDGNGRMARVVQTLVLAHDSILEPEFASIEEWLGHHTVEYYAVLASTGQGAWRPERSAREWVRFCLRAHHMQAQTVRRRFAEADRLWMEIDRLVAHHALPERVGDAMFDALIGLRVQRTGYLDQSGVETRTATRDLQRLTELGILKAVGETRGRHYAAGERLLDIRRRATSSRPPIVDPFAD